MRKGETHLEMVQRQIAEAEDRIARQLKVIERLRAGGHDTSGAEQLLTSHRDFLSLAQRQLEIATKVAGAAQ